MYAMKGAARMYPGFKELLSAFNAHNVRYPIVGGYAVSFHAQPRVTKDRDIPVRPGAGNTQSTYAALVKFGAQLEGLAPEDFAEGGSFFRMGREPVAADLLSEIPGVEFGAEWESALRASSIPRVASRRSLFPGMT